MTRWGSPATRPPGSAGDAADPLGCIAHVGQELWATAVLWPDTAGLRVFVRAETAAPHMDTSEEALVPWVEACAYMRPRYCPLGATPAVR